MAAKRPTGELPKRSSSLAKFISTGNNPKLTPAEARTAAGKYRDIKKAAGGFGLKGSMDKSGLALQKATAYAKNPSGKTMKKAAAGMAKKTAVKPSTKRK
jgi:hypothetical protein